MKQWVLFCAVVMHEYPSVSLSNAGRGTLIAPLQSLVLWSWREEAVLSTVGATFMTTGCVMIPYLPSSRLGFRLYPVRYDGKDVASCIIIRGVLKNLKFLAFCDPPCTSPCSVAEPFPDEALVMVTP